MIDIRPGTDRFAVAPQIAPADMAEAAAQGYRLVINNRPDGEAADQPSSADVASAAQAAGLGYAYIPVRGMPSADQVRDMAAAVEAAPGPVLAFCRSGTRSITIWALGEAELAARTPEDLIALGRAAGYDLSGVLG